MSEAGDYNPGPWKGHDFNSARKVYDVHVGRSYGDALKQNKSLDDVLPDEIHTESEAPLVILCDVTGSMGEWPATIFSKLPYLEIEGKEYLGDDMEICFGAIGDIVYDKYPLQMRPFTEGLDLKEQLKQLIVESGGGGNIKESYDIAALYCARNVHAPNAVKPICIIIGDEGVYDIINKDDSKGFAKVASESKLNTKDVFDELQRKFSVYLIRKPYFNYGGDALSAQDKVIQRQWESILGPERISILPEAGRVVDVIFGILANETNRVDYFKEELEDRQKPEQVETVMKSLKTIHELSGDSSRNLLKQGNSKMRVPSDGKKTKSLI